MTEQITRQANIRIFRSVGRGCKRFSIIASVPHKPVPSVMFSNSAQETEKITKEIITEVYRHHQDCEVNVDTPTSKHTYYDGDLPFSTEFNYIDDEFTDMTEFDKTHYINRYRRYIPDELLTIDNSTLSVFERVSMYLLRHGVTKDCAYDMARDAELRVPEYKQMKKGQ